MTIHCVEAVDAALIFGDLSSRHSMNGGVSRLKNRQMLTTFTLQEDFALGGGFTWRLKDMELRYRGSGAYSQLVNQRIPASEDRIADFIDALNLLDVWSWRDDYDPEDLGFVTMDGSSWTFALSIADRDCKCGGNNFSRLPHSRSEDSQSVTMTSLTASW
jgi:hypothetical protein